MSSDHPPPYVLVRARNRPRALACTIAGFEGDADRHVMMNMFREPLEFEVPVDPQRTWHLVVDNVAGASCRVQARSIVILAGTVS
jgi:pullulanase/glycogen debranching enzyme